MGLVRHGLPFGRAHDRKAAGQGLLRPLAGDLAHERIGLSFCGLQAPLGVLRHALQPVLGSLAGRMGRGAAAVHHGVERKLRAATRLGHPGLGPGAHIVQQGRHLLLGRGQMPTGLALGLVPPRQAARRSLVHLPHRRHLHLAYGLGAVMPGSGEMGLGIGAHLGFAAVDLGSHALGETARRREHRLGRHAGLARALPDLVLDARDHFAGVSKRW